ncbi:PREDICTED: uncharacterized protein LOC106334350 [Brassica oleracea var. oleracea]|uniref:uncharacterized protein LOC106334350 n=1 Tax=Brassica oleracea var. oleracea TaxID=109376 RepID=UPI0006A6AC11|nr:PREDICTED: uncharacterized protein LOC106334350 [Brassica oleracea var. oleracea]
MDEMIETMRQVWRVYNRVRGIALSNERFLFVFQREEDLVMVLNDRPWSFNHWTMLLDRWVPVPPKDFLTTVDVWVRISRIPMNHYRLETMDFLASKVRLDITRPALEKKVLNLPSGGQAVIEFEYEKLTKRCFHCLPLTHERPDCPYLREKVRPVFKEVVVSSNGRASNLKDPVGTVPPPGHAVPPGFSPMFPQLAEEERNAALQYVFHSDPTESQARIMRVQQSITDKGAVGARQMPLISHNLKKGKGHVFGYERQRKIGGDVFCSSKYMPFKLSTGLVVSCGADDLEVSSSSSPVGPTVFRIGSSTINHPTGTKSDGKKSRRRPQRWKRLSQTKACVAGDGDGLAGTDDALKKSALVIHGEDTVASAGFSKRKAVSCVGDHSTKSPKINTETVASALKPLPPQ